MNFWSRNSWNPENSNKKKGKNECYIQDKTAMDIKLCTGYGNYTNYNNKKLPEYTGNHLFLASTRL